MAINPIDITKTHKNACRIYFGLAVPAAGAELTLIAGVPDPTQNPNARQVGLTDDGAMMTITKTITEEFFDEYKESLEQTIDQVGMTIKCTAAQIMDFEVLTAASVGVGTPQTVTDKKKLQIGEGNILNTGIAIVSPLKSDPSLFVVSHIYAGHNVANLDVGFSRQTRSKIPLEFRGVGVTARIAADRMGAHWYQTA